MSLAHLLDDYLDTIDYLPADLSTALSAIHARSTEAADLHRALTRRRSLLLRPDSTLDAQALKKVGKEAARLQDLLKEKIELEEQVRRAMARQVARLDAALKKSGAQQHVELHQGHAGVVDDVAWPDALCGVCMAESEAGHLLKCEHCQMFTHQSCPHSCLNK
jgi:hypothetical protein